MTEQRSSTATETVRQCTCHPSGNPPVPCAKKFALSECRAHERLRGFVDIVWRHATEDASYPSTVTRDMLIERWGGGIPAQLMQWQPIGTAPRGVRISVARKGGQRCDGSTYWYQASGHFGLTNGVFHFSDGELYGAPEIWHHYPQNPEHCALPSTKCGSGE